MSEHGSNDSALPQNEKPIRKKRRPGILGYRRNFLIDKPHQIRAALLTTAVVLLLLVILNIAVYAASASAAAGLLEDAPELSAVIQSQDRFQLYLVVLASVVFLGAVFIVSILETHKTVGAAFNLSARMREVGEGRFNTRCRLRRGDRLRRLETAFNEMCQALEERSRKEAQVLTGLAAQVERAQGASNTGELAGMLKSLADEKRPPV